MNIEERVPVARLTTVGIGGPARAFVRPESVAELEKALAWAAGGDRWDAHPATSPAVMQKRKRSSFSPHRGPSELRMVPRKCQDGNSRFSGVHVLPISPIASGHSRTAQASTAQRYAVHDVSS